MGSSSISGAASRTRVSTSRALMASAQRRTSARVEAASSSGGRPVVMTLIVPHAPRSDAWSSAMPEATPTIYEWGGGREAFARWLNRFYDLVEGEPSIVRLFGGA